jgi:hypothetical protein
MTGHLCNLKGTDSFSQETPTMIKSSLTSFLAPSVRQALPLGFDPEVLRAFM